MKNLVKSLLLVSGFITSQSVVFAQDMKPSEQPTPTVAPKAEGKKKGHGKSKNGKQHTKAKDAKGDATSDKMPHNQEQPKVGE